MATSYFHIGIALLLLLTAGCGLGKAETGETSSTEIQSESELDSEMEQSIQLIMETGGIDRDSAEGTMETLTELGVPSIAKAELVSNHRGVVLQVSDAEDHVYYLGYGGFGYLEIVRRDSADGEILYAPED